MSFIEKIWEFLTGKVELRIKPEFHIDGQWFHNNFAIKVEDSCPKIPNPIGIILHTSGLPFNIHLERWLVIKVKLNGNEWREYFAAGIKID